MLFLVRINLNTKKCFFLGFELKPSKNDFLKQNKIIFIQINETKFKTNQSKQQDLKVNEYFLYLKNKNNKNLHIVVRIF